jgi:hypothetical protein
MSTARKPQPRDLTADEPELRQLNELTTKELDVVGGGRGWNLIKNMKF